MSRVTLTINEKLNLIKDFKQGVPRRELCTKYNVNNSTVCRVLKNEATIREVPNLKLRRRRKGERGRNVDRALLLWYEQMRVKQVRVNGPILMQKATDFAVQLKEDYTPTRSWLQRWCKRNDVSCAKVNSVTQGAGSQNGDTLDADYDINVPEILLNYSLECIYSAAECGLYYKALPNGSVDWKRPKQRLTVLFVCNAKGTYRHIHCIGRPKIPQSFNTANLPLPYYENANARLNTEIWTQILEELNRTCQQENKTILLLLVDNADCRKLNLSLTHIEIKFLPSRRKTTMQPLDHKLKQSFKMEYSKILAKRQIYALEKDKTRDDFLQSLTILDALHFVKLAWQQLDEDTIVSCFKQSGYHEKTGIKQELSDDDDTEDEKVIVDVDLSNYIDPSFSDDDPISFNPVMDKDILAQVLEEEEDEKPSIAHVTDETFLLNVPKPSTKDVLKSLDAIRAYCISHNIELMDAIDKIENTIFETVFNLKLT